MNIFTNKKNKNKKVYNVKLTDLGNLYVSDLNDSEKSMTIKEATDKAKKLR